MVPELMEIYPIQPSFQAITVLFFDLRDDASARDGYFCHPAVRIVFGDGRRGCQRAASGQEHGQNGTCAQDGQGRQGFDFQGHDKLSFLD